VESRRQWRRNLALALMVALGTAGPLRALFNNGGFEAGDLSGGWTVDVYQRDVMNPSTPPFPRSSIQLRDQTTNPGVNATEIVGNGTGRFAFTDPDTLASGPGLQYPRYGNYAARVNKQSAGTRNTNILKQSSVVTSADIDPFDNKVHVAFAYAAAAVNGGSGHDPHQQPFFYVTVYNKTRGNSVLFQKYAYADMPGVTWYTGASAGGAAVVKYTDWNIVDIAPGNGVLAVGDEIELEVIAAGCDPGAAAHQAWVYVDAFGSRLPGLAITASAPQYVHAGDNLTYTLAYRNGVEDEFLGTTATFELPLNTTFASVSDPAMCTYDNPTRTVTCNIGGVDRSGNGTFGVTVTVDPSATGTLTTGTYKIEATGEPAVYGQSVDTLVTTDTLVDLKTTVTGTPATHGGPMTYTVTVSNPTGANNPGNSAVTGATVTTALPAGLDNVTWTCAAGVGAACGASGTGSVNDTVDIPAGSEVVYTVTGTLNPSVAVGASISAQATVAVPSGYLDNDLTNNSDLAVKTVAANAADVSVTFDVTPDVVAPGGVAHYTVTVRNLTGSTVPGVLVTLPGGLPAEFSSPTWICTPAGAGSVCANPAGPGLNETVTLGPNGTATYTLTAAVAPSATVGGNVTLSVNAALPPSSGFADSDPANNTATKVSPIAGLVLTSISPSGGRAEGGTLVTLRGMGFAGHGTTPTVLLGGLPGTDVQVIDDNTIVVRAPALPPGTPLDVALSFGGAPVDQAMLALSYTPVTEPADRTTDTDTDGVPDWWELQWGTDPLVDDGAADPDGDGQTNAQEFAAGTHPRGFYSLYFAEGANSWFFETRIALANPNAAPAATLMRYLRSDAMLGSQILNLAGSRRATVMPGEVSGFDKADFSTVVESDIEIAAERTMTWLPEERYGAHAETAMKAPAPEWYLAEGATFGGFTVFYLIENPNVADTEIDVTYILPSPNAPIVKRYPLKGLSRRTILVNDEDERLKATDVSAVVRSVDHAGIIVERAMYKSAKGKTFSVGHEAAGVTAPSRNWFFAEGATGSFFDMWMLLANPGSTDAQVTLRYLLPLGAPVDVVHEVKANSRITVNVEHEGEALRNQAMSVVVLSDEPILAERAMYWPGADEGGWGEGHDATGATQTGTMWVVADGELGGAFHAETFVLVANTSAFEGHARVTLLLEDGAPLTADVTLPANSRYNVTPSSMDEFKAAAKDKRFSVLVESLGATPAQIVIERSTYTSDAEGHPWAAGTAALGTKLR
jgi:uncharacterized repeat protein (TIGR01451 family)